MLPGPLVNEALVRRVLTNRFYLSVSSRPVSMADFSSPDRAGLQIRRKGAAPCPSYSKSLHVERGEMALDARLCRLTETILKSKMRNYSLPEYD